eukprot:gene8309-14272_t
MIRFKRNPKIHERYNLLTAPALNLDEDEKKQGGGEEFATFLRSLSSTKQSSQSTGSGGVARTKFSNVGSKSFDNEKSKSDLPGYQPRQGGGVAAIMQLKSKNQEIHDKQLKVIEDHMWQHKQEERELKRIEGDIVKKQRQLRKTMQDYESAVYKKQREEEIQALKAKGDLEKIKQDAAAQENRLTREKIDKNISSIQRSKERDRKGQTSISSQELQYERIAEEINRRRLEVESMTKEFENKMKLKEEEVYKLRKELGEMAISINMESQKQRTLKYDEENGTTAKALQAERKQQELDKHLDTTLNHISLKIREEGRKLTDVKSRLQKNSQLQRDAQSDALHAAYNRQALDSDEKIKLVDARKAALQNSLTRDRKQRGAQILDEWRNRYLERTNEVKMKEVEDSVKHLSKFVAKQEDIEQSLYNQVKSSESERRKQEQTVEGIRQELSAVKKENARLIKETSIRCHKREEELVQKLLREEAALKKALSEREEKIRSFVKQRGFYQEEKDMLAKEQKIMHIARSFNSTYAQTVSVIED